MKMHFLTAFACLAGGLLGADKLERVEVPGAYETKVYTDVTILGVTDKGIKVAHSGGLVVLPPTVFPEALQKKYALTAPMVPDATAMTPGVAPATMPAGSDPIPESVVLVNGADGGGSGFLVREAGRVYFYSAVHVMAGIAKAKFVTPSGAVLPIGEATVVEISDDDACADVCRIAMPANVATALEWAGEVKIGDDITALGNSLAEKVVARVDGKIGGVGVGEIELRCDVVPGNSGGPVLLKDSGKVVGLVTRASLHSDDVWVNGTTFGGVRRFAARPTKIAKWTTMSLYNLRQQSARLDRIRDDTRVLACVILLSYFRDGVTAPDSRQGDYSIRDVLKAGSGTSVGGAVNGAIATLNRDLRLGATATLSEAAAKPIYARFFGAVFQAAKSDVASASTADYIRYHRPRFEQEAELRKKITAGILDLSGRVAGARFR